MTALRGRTVVITGAAGGIGLRIAETALDQGARVVGWDRNPAALRAWEQRRPLEVQQGRLLTDSVDVSDNTAVQAAATEVLRRTGHVDVLVNNAGVVSGEMLLDLTPEQIERTIGVNVLALFWTTKAFLPGMVERNSGHVVTVSSAAGLLGVRRQTDYSASKHAAVGFDASLRAEMRQVAPGVLTTVVCPFYVDTGMFHGAKTRVPWLLPILSEEYVAERIVRAVEHNRPRVFLPWVIRNLYLGQFMPTAFFDSLMDLMGVNVSMDEFVGRSDSPAEAGATQMPLRRGA